MNEVKNEYKYDTEVSPNTTIHLIIYVHV